MVFFYVFAAVAAIPLALGAWNRGARLRRLFLPAILLLTACSAGGLLVVSGGAVDDGGTGGAAEAGSPCAEQDPTCPASFAHAVTCRFYPNGPCQEGQCIAPWLHCTSNISDGCETDTSSDPAHCGVCDVACDSGVCKGGVCS